MYLKNNVFPLRAAYKFARNIGGQIEVISNAIAKRGSIPHVLKDRKYEMRTSQARRALIYLLLNKYGVWGDFVKNYWPGATTRTGVGIIDEFKKDYINNGKLSKHKGSLPLKIQTIIP